MSIVSPKWILNRVTLSNVLSLWHILIQSHDPITYAPCIDILVHNPRKQFKGHLDDLGKPSFCSLHINVDRRATDSDQAALRVQKIVSPGCLYSYDRGEEKLTKESPAQQACCWVQEVLPAIGLRVMPTRPSMLPRDGPEQRHLTSWVLLQQQFEPVLQEVDVPERASSAPDAAVVTAARAEG